LRRGKARGVKDTLADLRAFAGAPIVPAVVFGSDAIVQHRPQLLPVAPEQDLRLRPPLLHLEVIAV
jgi:hypothetical protein